jgi:hypothetical protein
VAAKIDRRAERHAVRDSAAADVRLGLQQAERRAFILETPSRGNPAARR